MEDNTLAGLTERIKQVDRGATVIDQDTTVVLSTTLTGIQNAFNRMLTYSKNMNRIQEAKLEDTGLYNKEAQLEAPRAIPIAQTPVASDSALVDLIPALLKVVKKLDKELEGLDLSSGNNGGDDIGDLDIDRKRQRGRGRARTRGALRNAGRFAKGAAITAAAAYTIDAGFGMFGVGKGLDEGALDKQDDANWDRMSTLNKVESGAARAIETAGEVMFLDNLAAEAKASRVRDETAYLDERDEEKNPRADKAVQRNKIQDEKLISAATKASTGKVQAMSVRKPEPTKAMSRQGNEWTGKVSSFIGDTYQNVTSFMGGFLAKLASLGSQLGDFLSGGAQSLAGMFGFGGGPGYAEADVGKAKGDWVKDKPFITGVNQLAQKYDLDAGDLLGLMHSESNINPQARNPSGATGLIQFMPQTAKEMGTTTDAISKLNRTQQLSLVDQFFKMKKLPKGASAGQLYATVFLPAYNRKADNFVVARANGLNDAGKGSPKWYSQNAGLDVNRDGEITIADLGQRLSKKRQEIGLGASRAGSGFRALGNLASGALSGAGGLFQDATSMLRGVGDFIFPLASVRVTSTFGPRSSPTRGASSQHHGIDFGPRVPGKSGDPVHAAADGTVTKAGGGKGYGNVVYIDHGNGLETRYAHLMAFTTNQGVRVRKGEQVGLLGNTGVGTGPHLHFEIRRNGSALDPLRLLKGSAVVRPDPSASEPGNEQKLKPGQKPVARPTSEIARDAQQVAIDKKKQQLRSTSTSRGTPGRRPPQVIRGGPGNKPQQQKKSTMGQFLSYFGAG